MKLELRSEMALMPRRTVAVRCGVPEGPGHHPDCGARICFHPKVLQSPCLVGYFSIP